MFFSFKRALILLLVLISFNSFSLAQGKDVTRELKRLNAKCLHPEGPV